LKKGNPATGRTNGAKGVFHMSTNRITDEIFSPIGPPAADEQATRFIDIHIYEQEPEPEEPPSVESQQEPKPAVLDENDQEHTESVCPHRQQRRYIIVLCAGIVCVLVVSALVILSLLPLWTPDVTITIVPSTRQIRTTMGITITTGPATGTQLQGRALSAITMTQARTVATTGKGHQDAKAAQGYITFYNAATYPQAVSAGTLLTGADGIQVVTEQNANIPAASYPTFGQITVVAQSANTGDEGNIRAGDIYGPCCRLNVSAVSSVFSGGQQARDYQTVTLQDINTVASNLKTSLNQSVQAALQTQVQSDETLITPLPCQQNVKSDYQPGDEAAQVNITVSETCTGMTYTSQVYQEHIMQIANQQATNKLGEGYIPVGQVQSTITQARASEHNQTELQITLAETYAYQVSSQQQQDIKTRIAGKSKTQATNTLLHIPGIQSVSVSSDTIPTDTQHIRVIVVYVR
jgi:type IV secretory pathway component VirB8